MTTLGGLHEYFKSTKNQTKVTTSVAIAHNPGIDVSSRQEFIEGEFHLGKTTKNIFLMFCRDSFVLLYCVDGTHGHLVTEPV